MNEVNRRQKALEPMKDAPDDEVLAASRRNPELFSILVERYEAAFLRKAKSILYTPEDAEEVVQMPSPESTSTQTVISLRKVRASPPGGMPYSSVSPLLDIRK